MSVIAATMRASTADEAKRLTRFDAEQAVRTLIRWAGDDPNRAGLLDTPARFARAFEEYFAGYAADPAKLLSTTFEETNGYDEMIVLNTVREPLRASYCTNSRQGMGSLCAKWTSGWNFQASARRGGFRQTTADSRTTDRTDRPSYSRRFSAPRRCRCAQGKPSLLIKSRSTQA